jgi:hypothetical protein
MNFPSPMSIVICPAVTDQLPDRALPRHVGAGCRGFSAGGTVLALNPSGSLLRPKPPLPITARLTPARVGCAWRESESHGEEEVL